MSHDHSVCFVMCFLSSLKVKNGKWQSPSAYCPLDLFSGYSVDVKPYKQLNIVTINIVYLIETWQGLK